MKKFRKWKGKIDYFDLDSIEVVVGGINSLRIFKHDQVAHKVETATK